MHQVLNPRIIGNIMLSYSVFADGLLCPLILLRFPNITPPCSKPCAADFNTVRRRYPAESNCKRTSI